MEKEGFFVEVKELLESYIDDRLLLMKLQATEKAAKASSVLFIIMAVSFLSLILIMIVSFIAGYYLSQWVNSYPGGFAILGLIYIMLIFVLVFVHKKILGKRISDAIVRFSFHSTEKFSNEI